MNWLKGLVAPTAQYVGGAPQAAPPPQGAPWGGAPDMPPVGGSPYGGYPPPTGAQPQPQPPSPGVPDAMQWSTGTRTQSGAAAPAGTAALEARITELSNDVASLALFARTLLTLLEDGKVVTREQFIETKNRLDALDGKIDDR